MNKFKSGRLQVATPEESDKMKINRKNKKSTSAQVHKKKKN